MVFSSIIFLWVFLPLVLLIYFLSNDKVKNIVLLLASLIFYAWGEPKYIIIMIFSILINYLFGIIIDKNEKKNAIKKCVFVAAIIVNILLLGYFKYFNFFAINFNNLFSKNIIEVKKILLPIGISFYTFQIMSYIIDLYRGDIKVQKNILNLALYVSFFPQLIAGPIVKYKDVENEIQSRKITIDLFSSGIKKFVYGLGKKVIISNSLAILVDNIYSNNVISLNTPILWLASIAYMFQIYYDFSGYSDMAIGLGRMFGFHFPENFNLPYISQSITEFWRRWHISLSSWFKQYLYIPLGGNRKGKIRTYLNLLIVFFVTGLWHGASWNFIFWGGFYYGTILIIERLFLKRILDSNRFKFINHFYSLFIILIGWVFFRADSLTHAFSIIKMMFSFNFSNIYITLPTFMNLKIYIILVLAIVFSGFFQTVITKSKKYNLISKIYHERMELLIIIIILFLSIFELVSSSYNPFIYFRF